MKRIIAFIVIISLISALQPTTFASEASPKKSAFKVMGYFNENPFNDPIDDSIRFEGLTHVIYAFVKPNADGSLLPIGKPARLKELVEKSHQHGVKVIIAVGGVMSGKERVVTNFETLSAKEESRVAFVDNLSRFMDEYQLDGIEIDWEFPKVETKDRYEKLMLALRDMLSKKGKSLSAAVAGAVDVVSNEPYHVGLSDQALASVDWINVMAYDLAGGLKGPQSPYWHANVSVRYYLKRGIPAEKIVLGVPLVALPSWKQYRHLVALNKENAYVDYIPDAKLPSYYDGLNTISDKTRMALNIAGGIMFFDIQEDTHDETSAQRATVEMIKRYERTHLKDLFIVVNNHELVFPEALGTPYIDTKNRTMVPVRLALETIGVKVDYEAATQTVTMTKEGTSIQLVTGSDTLLVNNQPVKMDTVSVVKAGRTYMPLSAIYEHFGYTLLYHNDSKTIIVTKK